MFVFCTRPSRVVGLFVLSIGSLVPHSLQAQSIPVEDEIIVTARRIEEPLQSAPAAITVFTSADLDLRQAIDLRDIGAASPNVTISSSGTLGGYSAAPVIFIRGLGQPDFVINTDAAVGVYIDGVYIGRPIASLLDLASAEQVEVLRGPQGTLFGHNTIGGAVLVTGKKPDASALQINLQLAGGERGFFQGKGDLNIPLNDHSALLISGMHRRRDGYVDALQYDDFQLGEENVWGVRAVLDSDVADFFNASVAVDFIRRREAPAPVVPVQLGNVNFDGNTLDPSGVPTASRFNSGGPPAIPPAPSGFGSVDPVSCSTAIGRATDFNCYGNVWIPNDPDAVNSIWTDATGARIEPQNQSDSYGVSGSLNFASAFGDIKSITSFRKFDSEFFNDFDYTPFTIFHNNNEKFEQNQISQEVQIIGAPLFADRVEYVAGLFFFRETGIEAVDVIAPLVPAAASQTSLPLFQTNVREITNRSLAGYANISWVVTDQLKIGAGARYTSNKKSFVLTLDRSVQTGLTAAQGQLRLGRWTPSAFVSYDVNGGLTVYGSYARGFRDGGFPSRFLGGLIAPLPFFDPEKVDSFEFGAKARMFDGRVRANAALFRMNYDNIQVTAISPTIGGTTATANLADATIQGAEFEVQSELASELHLDLSIGLLDSSIDEIFGGELISGAGNQMFSITAENELPFSPTLTMAGGITHEFGFSAGQVVSRVDWSYTGKQQFRIENHPLTEQRSYHVVSASLRFQPRSRSWGIFAGGRNLFNERFSTNASLSTAASSIARNRSRPRELYAGISVAL